MIGKITVKTNKGFITAENNKYSLYCFDVVDEEDNKLGTVKADELIRVLKEFELIRRGIIKFDKENKTYYIDECRIN